MGSFEIKWHTGDFLLDEALTRHFENKIRISKYGLMFFRRMSWLAESPEARTDIVYGHVSVQLEEYVGKQVLMLCGDSMNVYAISDLNVFDSIEQLNDDQLCIRCCSKAEKIYWLKQAELQQDVLN